MKRKSTVILCFFVAMMTLASSAFTVNATELVTTPDYPGMVFAVDWDDNYILAGYNGGDENLVIPETVNDIAVKRIAEKGLYENQTIRSLTMHDNMTQVRKWGVRNCDNLESVYYSKSLVIIYDYAFAYDPKLSSALLGNTEITRVSAGTYISDGALKYVSLPDTVKSLDGLSFAGTAIKTFVVNDGCEKLDNRCFAYNESLTAVYVPQSVVSFGEAVFDQSPNVTVYGVEGSAIDTYCRNNGISFTAVTPEQFPSSLSGDVNNDGKLSVRDATSIQLELAGMNPEFLPQNCDANADCSFNISDATYIQKKLVRLV